MTRAENVFAELARVLEGTFMEDYISPVIRESEGEAFTDEWQAGGPNRASDVAALMLNDLSQQLPASKVIDSIIFRMRTSPEFPVLMFESRIISREVQNIVSRGSASAYDDVSPVGDKLILSLVCWIKDRK